MKFNLGYFGERLGKLSEGGIPLTGYLIPGCDGIWVWTGSGVSVLSSLSCCRRRRPLPRKVVFGNGSKKHKSGKTRSCLNFHADRQIEIEFVHTNSSRQSYLEGFNPLRRRQYFCVFQKIMFFPKIKGFPQKSHFFVKKVIVSQKK